MKIAVVDTYYQAFLDKCYSLHSCNNLDYDAHLRWLLDQQFGTSDSYSFWFKAYGVDAIDYIANSMPLQLRWATEYASDLLCLNGAHFLEAVLLRQLRKNKPDILYLQDIHWPSKRLLAEIRELGIIVVAQHCSPLTSTSLTFHYDQIFSALPPLVRNFRNAGIKSEYVGLCVDFRFTANNSTNGIRDIGLSFIGGVGPLHRKRIALLETITKHTLNLQCWGYGYNMLQPEMELLRSYKGEAWGHDMYDILKRSIVTVNAHGAINVPGADNYGINMRLHEACGSSTCLMTESKLNMPFMYEPDHEVVTYSSIQECIEKLYYLQAHPEECFTIGRKASERARRDHSYEVRIPEIIGHLRELLGSRHESNKFFQRPAKVFSRGSIYFGILIIVTNGITELVRERINNRLEELRSHITSNRKLGNQRIALFSLLNPIVTGAGVCLWQPDEKSCFADTLADYFLITSPASCIILHNGSSTELTQAESLLSTLPVPYISYNIDR